MAQKKHWKQPSAWEWLFNSEALFQWCSMTTYRATDVTKPRKCSYRERWIDRTIRSLSQRPNENMSEWLKKSQIETGSKSILSHLVTMANQVLNDNHRSQRHLDCVLCSLSLVSLPWTWRFMCLCMSGHLSFISLSSVFCPPVSSQYVWLFSNQRSMVIGKSSILRDVL